MTDTLSLIMKYNKGKSQTGHRAYFIDAFVVSSATPDTLADDVIFSTTNQVPVTLSIYVLYFCTQEMSSFHFQIIT